MISLVPRELPDCQDQAGKQWSWWKHPVFVLCLQCSDGLLSCSDHHIQPAASCLLFYLAAQQGNGMANVIMEENMIHMWHFLIENSHITGFNANKLLCIKTLSGPNCCWIWLSSSCPEIWAWKYEMFVDRKSWAVIYDIYEMTSTNHSWIKLFAAGFHLPHYTFQWTLIQKTNPPPTICSCKG